MLIGDSPGTPGTLLVDELFYRLNPLILWKWVFIHGRRQKFQLANFKVVSRYTLFVFQKMESGKCICIIHTGDLTTYLCVVVSPIFCEFSFSKPLFFIVLEYFSAYHFKILLAACLFFFQMKYSFGHLSYYMLSLILLNTYLLHLT